MIVYYLRCYFFLKNSMQNLMDAYVSEFIVDGRRAGPGDIRVELKGVRSALPVHVTPLKYDRYRCTYTPPLPGK